MMAKTDFQYTSYTYEYPVVDVAATGQNLQECCKAKSISAKTIADKLNITPQAVNKWFHGKSICDIDHLIALSCILEEPIDQLVKRKKC